MEAITEFVGTVNGIVWGIPMLILILGAGLFLTIGLRFLSIMKIPFGFSLLWKGRIPGDDAGDITPFNALMTSLSATIGTGNIAGVATAIFLGGPGAVFWMWMTAVVGMATKYAEAVCAVRFRETDENGNFVGGPMYYIQNGMVANWRWLAITFALFAGIAGFGIGNMVQSNSIADALNTNFGIPHLYYGYHRSIARWRGASWRYPADFRGCRTAGASDGGSLYPRVAGRAGDQCRGHSACARLDLYPCLHADGRHRRFCRCCSRLSRLKRSGTSVQVLAAICRRSSGSCFRLCSRRVRRYLCRGSSRSKMLQCSSRG